MNRSYRLLVPLSGIARSARSLGRRISAKATKVHVPHWSDYLRETQVR